MAGRHFRVKKRPPSPAAQFVFFREEVAKSQVKIADRHVTQRVALPVNRNGRFKFGGSVKVEGTHILTQVALQNESESLGRYGHTVKDLWRWLNLGTPAHVILPRFKRALAFVVGGASVVVRRVFHPGTKPQRNTERVNQSLEPFRKKETAKGFRDAWKKLEKFNKR